jgi:hypothetical protein
VLGHIRQIVHEIGKPIDIVWSFEPNLYSDLRAFSAPLTIYHPVDVVLYPYQIEVARSADVVLTVSESIRSHFVSMNAPSYVINHGLAQPFAELARSADAKSSVHEPNRADRQSRVGYAGNLGHPAVDRTTLRRTIAKRPSVEFHFWGPPRPPLDAAPGSPLHEFFAFLYAQSNVHLHGEVATVALANALEMMDCLILCYTCDTPIFDCSNSHKLLEYLSTGRPIVSTSIAYYKGRDDLLRMSQTDGSDFEALLDETLANLERFISPEMQKKRRAFALENTYAHQLRQIEQLIRT